MAIVTVLGAGMMGSALCLPLCDRGHEVRLVGTHLDGAIVDSLARDRFHPTLRERLPEAVRPMPVDALAEALRGTELVALGVSSAGIGWAVEQLRPHARPELPLFMITKGLRFEGRLRVLPDVVADALGGAPAAVAGPCIAGELARRVDSCVVLAGRDQAVLDRIAQTIGATYYHVRPTVDVVGAEVCAALKNAYAMGIAFGAGLHERHGGQPGSVATHNYESAVFAQGVLEMQRVVQALGGEPGTAAGLAGVGDLDVTTNGGRTGRFGKLLGLGLTVPEAIERMQGATLECLEILAVMRQALPSLGGDLPLLEHLIEVALDGKPLAMPFDRFFR